VCTATATGTPCSPTVSIFSDSALTVPITSLLTDANGNYGFWIAPGHYKLTLTGNNTQPITLDITPGCIPGASGCAGGGSGTVTSVALVAVPSVLTVSGSPVTTSGTLTIGFAGAQTQNEFLATPNGAAGELGLRAAVEADLPSATVFTDQNATFGAHTYDFSGATLFKGRVGAGLTTTANGGFGFDSTNSNWHFWNGADAVMAPLAAGFVSGHCGQPTSTSGKWVVADSGNPCNTGGSAFTGGLGASFQDATEIAAPANPSAGNDRLFLSSVTHQLSCLTSTGTSCMPTGGTGTPGGSANQLQFNSAGAFGGIAGSTATANGGISFFPAADTPGLAVHPFATAISDPFQVFAETAVSVPSTPSLGQVAGGTLGSRTDFVQIAYAGYSGVFTTYSAQQSRAVSVNNLLTVTSPSATTGAAGWLPAIASTTGGETNLETVTSANCTLATGLPENAPAICAIGANWTEPTTGFNASGPAKPASNLTQVKAFSVDSSGNIHCQNCAVPVSNGFTSSAAQPIGVDSTTGLFHSWTGAADAVDTQKAGAWTAGDCLKANDTVGGIADSGPCGGGGSSAWSALTAPAAN